jgi:hypothetical protein
MTGSQDHQQLRNQQSVLVIMWYSIVFMILFFLFVPMFLSGDSISLPKTSAPGFLRRALWVLAILQAIFLVWWRKRYFTIERPLEGSDRDNIVGALVKRAQNGMGQRAGKVSWRYFLRSILAFGIAESIALYGLVLAVTGHYVVDQYSLSALSLMLLFYFYPSNTLFGHISEQAET